MAATVAGARERGEPGQAGDTCPRALYFCGSIRGGREDRALYQRIVSRLRRFGTVLTEHVAFAELGAQGEEAAGGDRLIHERDLAWLQRADLVVAEVTQPSLGVGYELGRAAALNKQVLCLFRPQSGRVLSAMIRGAADGSRFQVWDYEEGEVEALLDRYFEAHPHDAKLKDVYNSDFMYVCMCGRPQQGLHIFSPPKKSLEAYRKLNDEEGWCMQDMTGELRRAFGEAAQMLQRSV